MRRDVSTGGEPEVDPDGLLQPNGVGPAGADGADGEQGIQGIQGIQGDPGADGQDGAPGDITAAWPVGSVFLSVVSTSPATLLGFGTWSQIAGGRFLVGQTGGDTDFDVAEETGGEKTHVLSAAEMPAHTHVQDAHTHIQNAHNHSVVVTRSATTGAATTETARSTDASSTILAATTGDATAGNQNATPTNQNAGGGDAHNNLPPFLVLYVWKRTA